VGAPGSLTVLIGAPGSGKSTHAARRAELGETVISSDAIRAEHGDVNDQTRNDEVFAEIHARVSAGLMAGRRIVVDATNTKPTERAALLAIAAETGTEWTLAVVIQTPLAVCLARNAARDRHVPEGFIHEAHARVDRLDHADLFTEGFTHVQFLDKDGQSLASYDHPYPAGVEHCTDCRALAQSA
jgi:predicted kinase